MKNETKNKLKGLLKQTLHIIGLEEVEDTFELEELNVENEPTIKFFEKNMIFKPDSFLSKVGSVIGIDKATTILVPEYMLDENGSLTTEINYDLVPEDKKELVQELGPVCLEVYEESGQELVKPIFLDKEINKEEVEMLLNATQVDYGFEEKTWNQFAEDFLGEFISDKKEYVKKLTINQIPENTTLEKTGITGEVETNNKRRDIIMLSCAIVATIMIAWLALNNIHENIQNTNEKDEPVKPPFKLSDPMADPVSYSIFPRK
ncbi:MAG: hypothetical protein IJB71_04835 [Bacilli bacterium]|nr:hypothetical protein [Bacilli bacterium]